MDEEYMIAYFVVGLISCIIFGCITRAINTNKGYEGGFAWGFWLGVIGIIVVACRADNRHYYDESEENSALSAYAKEVSERRIMDDGGWKCSRCGRINASYSTSCACGITMKESKNWGTKKIEVAVHSQADEIKKYKELLDSGAITQEEYDAKKKQLLGL